MEEHICRKEYIITELSKKITTQKTLGEETYARVAAVEKNVQEHRQAQRLMAEETSLKLDNLSVQMTDLIILNNEVKDIKTAWKVGKNIGLGLAAFITVLSIISGGLWAFKEWIKK